MSERKAPEQARDKDILVLIGAETPGAMAWMLIDIDTMEERAHGVADDGAPAPRAPTAHTMLVLPGADALVKRVELNARTEAQARAAAPFLFEGSLAGGGSPTHYAIGAAQDESGMRLVAAISAVRLAEWMEAARALGATPSFLWLDCTVWPTERGAIDIVETPQRTIVAAGAFGGFGIEPDLAPALFASWRSGVFAPIDRVRLIGGDAEMWRRQLGAEARLLEVAEDRDPLLTLVRGAAAAPEHAPNLLQGMYAQKKTEKQPLRLWRFAAALAVLAVFLQVFSMVVAGWRDAREARATLAVAAREFRALRPELGETANLQSQVATLVRTMSQAQDQPVLKVNEPVIRALRAHPLVRLDEVRHESPERTVRMRFSSLDPQALEALGGELRGQGLSFDVHSIAPVEGRYTVEAAIESP
ncbi:MAG: hypothetical protein JNJ73_06400 [Hyphomonadaceae bacterium]|nr:hypothetical protein [Hyphomonadaceae bacterium]